MVGKRHRREPEPTDQSAPAAAKLALSWPDDGSPALEESHLADNRVDSAALRQTGANVFFSGISGDTGF